MKTYDRNINILFLFFSYFHCEETVKKPTIYRIMIVIGQEENAESINEPVQSKMFFLGGEGILTYQCMYVFLLHIGPTKDLISDALYLQRMTKAEMCISAVFTASSTNYSRHLQDQW